MQHFELLLQRHDLRHHLTHAVLRKAAPSSGTTSTLAMPAATCVFPHQNRRLTVKHLCYTFVTLQKTIRARVSFPAKYVSLLCLELQQHGTICASDHSRPPTARHVLFTPSEATVKPDNRQRVVLLATHCLPKRQATTQNASAAPCSERSCVTLCAAPSSAIRSFGIHIARTNWSSSRSSFVEDHLVSRQTSALWLTKLRAPGAPVAVL